MQIRSGQAYYDPTIGGWNLLNGDGIREYRTTISFKEVFEKEPTVMIALSGLDIIKYNNANINIYLNNHYYSLIRYLLKALMLVY